MSSDTKLLAAEGNMSERTLRERLIPDGASEEEIAKALRKCRRSVQRLGLPFRKVGRTRIY
jgi:hypothetical protein